MIPRPLPFSLRLLAAVSVCLLVVSYAAADTSNDGQPEATAAKPKAETAEKEKKKPKYPPFAELLGDTECIDGLIKLYRKDNKLYAELTSSVMEKDLLVAITLARGVGLFPLVGGLSWMFGNDWIWQFRKVDDNIQIVRRNVRFRAPGSQDYNDSVLYSLPIATMHGKNCVVDLTDVFISDLVGIERISSFRFDAKRSTWAKVKGFKNNVEIEVATTYTGLRVYTVPDARGAATMHMHYSISLLPTKTGYKPRLADDRVGHFVTAIKDFTKSGSKGDQFVRYIDRWDLRKVDPSAEVSLPVAPIVFWIEKTVPNKYRLAVRNGIMEWNKAFERAGFAGAIEVRQQPDDATWDPEDINYNTLRWINSFTTIAVGPRHVNPKTGQILDSDVIVDASFIDYWTRLFETEKPGLTNERSAAPSSMNDFLDVPRQVPTDLSYDRVAVYDYAQGMSQQLAFGAMALAIGDKPATKKEQEEKDKRIKKLLDEGMKALVTHEVGHSLGLRHNFKASAYMTMEEINDPYKTREVGLTASIMDYIPVNIAPKGKKQGDYFSRTIGPYDYWAIEYAYKQAKGGKGDKGDSEEKMLAKIASRCAEPALHYATDEDAHAFHPYGTDPSVNPFDLGKNPCEFARWRVELIDELLPGLADQITEPGEGYQNVRKAFKLLMREHAHAMYFVGRYIGGVYVNRDHEGDPGARPPLVVAEAKKQREALELLEQQVFGPKAYQFPTKLYSFLTVPYWSHWGMPQWWRRPPADFPVHDMVLLAQTRVLFSILSKETLSRLCDSELKTPADADVFTAAELLQGLTAAIFSETEKLQEGKFTNRAPAISSFRRNLQRRYFERLAAVAKNDITTLLWTGVMGNIRFMVYTKLTYPADCQAVAYGELEALEARLKQVLGGEAQLDAYSRGHLSELASRIRKVLDARFYLHDL